MIRMCWFACCSVRPGSKCVVRCGVRLVVVMTTYFRFPWSLQPSAAQYTSETRLPLYIVSGSSMRPFLSNLLTILLPMWDVPVSSMRPFLCHNLLPILLLTWDISLYSMRPFSIICWLFFTNVKCLVVYYGAFFSVILCWLFHYCRHNYELSTY